MSEKRHRAPATARRVPFLIVNAARSVILQPYALAHAFAHLSLGPGDVVDQRTEWTRTNPREAAANDFAEEFLTPARAVSRWYDPRAEQTPATDTLLELGKALGISVRGRTLPVANNWTRAVEGVRGAPRLRAGRVCL